MGASFTVSTVFADLAARAELAKSQIEASKAELLKTVGVAVLSHAQMDYRTLSRGGSTPDGRKWAALAISTIKRKAARGRPATSKKRTTSTGQALPVGLVSAIGIDTGLQQASGSPGFADPGGGNVFKVDGSHVTVGYGRSYSKYFDEKRKLLPDRLPDEWRETLAGIVGAWVSKIVTGTIFRGSK